MKNLKVLFTVLCVACATAVWGESIEINTSNSGVKGSYADDTFTISNVQFGYTQWMKNTNIQAKKSTTNSCYNVEAIPGTITKITVEQTGTARAIKMFGGTTAKPTSSITSPSTASKMVFDFSGKEYTYFSITTPGNACYFQTITIEYESGGSTETTPSITQQPKDATYDQGATPAALTITASGNPTPTYRWYSNTSKDNSNGTAISGATEASYTPSTATAGTFYYYCVATNSKGSATSDVATIKVNAAQTYTVLWSLGGDEYAEGNPTTSVKSGERVTTLPTPPDGNAIGSCANTFMGWSTHDLGKKKGQSAPTDLFTTAECSPVITQDTIFYAVFATDPTK